MHNCSCHIGIIPFFLRSRHDVNNYWLISTQFSFPFPVWVAASSPACDNNIRRLTIKRILRFIDNSSYVLCFEGGIFMHENSINDRSIFYDPDAFCERFLASSLGIFYRAYFFFTFNFAHFTQWAFYRDYLKIWFSPAKSELNLGYEKAQQYELNSVNEGGPR